MNVLFEFSNDPFSSDLASQYARMALSISMENNVTMVYRGEASVLSLMPFDIPVHEHNYFEQERFLIEQEIDMFVLSNDVKNLNGDLKENVITIDHEKLNELYKDQNIIFRN